MYNCEPGNCPSESACVVFDAQLSPLLECRNYDELSRFERAFCMFNCSSDSECRAGYVCADLASPENRDRYNALVVDPDRGTRVCVAAFSAKSVTDPSVQHSTEVCTGAAAGGEGGSAASPGDAGSGGTGG